MTSENGLRRIHHCRPKPSAFSIALVSSLASLASDSYSGIRIALKHVWAVGSLLLSGPARWISRGSSWRPPTGALHDQALLAEQGMLLMWTALHQMRSVLTSV